MEKLFVYGSLQPGGSNEHVLAGLEGCWEPGRVRGILLNEGWGADQGYPGLILDEDGPVVHGFVFSSAALSARWDELDDFEGSEYARRRVSVTLDNGESVCADVYALCDGHDSDT